MFGPWVGVHGAGILTLHMKMVEIPCKQSLGPAAPTGKKFGAEVQGITPQSEWESSLKSYGWTNQ